MKSTSRHKCILGWTQKWQMMFLIAKFEEGKTRTSYLMKWLQTRALCECILNPSIKDLIYFFCMVSVALAKFQELSLTAAVLKLEN